VIVKNNLVVGFKYGHEQQQLIGETLWDIKDAIELQA